MKKRVLKFVSAGIVYGLLGSMVMATDGEWRGYATETGIPKLWSNTSAWLNGQIANGVGSTFTLNRSSVSVGVNRTASIDMDVTLGSIIISDGRNQPAGNRDATITVIENGTLTLDGGAGEALISNRGSQSLTVNVLNNPNKALEINTDTRIENLTGNVGFFTMKGDIVSGNNSTNLKLTLASTNDRVNMEQSIHGNITVVAAGNSGNWTTLNSVPGNVIQHSTYSGGTIIEGAAMIRGYSNQSFGTGDITFQGAGGRLGLSFNATHSPGYDFENNIVISGTSGIIETTTGVEGATLTGLISGSGKLIIASNTKADPRSIKIAGDNSYAGGTRVEGALFVNNTGAGSGTGTGDVEVAATAKIGGSGRISGGVITEGAATLQVGYGAVGGFSIGALTLGGDLTINYGDVVGLLTIAGQLDLSGHNIIFDLTGYTVSDMELISFSSLENGSASSFSIVGLSGYDLQLGASGVSLVAIPEPGTYAAILGAAMMAFILIRRRRG